MLFAELCAQLCRTVQHAYVKAESYAVSTIIWLGSYAQLFAYSEPAFSNSRVQSPISHRSHMSRAKWFLSRIHFQRHCCCILMLKCLGTCLMPTRPHQQITKLTDYIRCGKSTRTARTIVHATGEQTNGHFLMQAARWRFFHCPDLSRKLRLWRQMSCSAEIFPLNFLCYQLCCNRRASFPLASTFLEL